MLKVKMSTKHCENDFLNKELQGITSKRAGGNGEALKGNVKALKDDTEALRCDWVC